MDQSGCCCSSLPAPLLILQTNITFLFFPLVGISFCFSCSIIQRVKNLFFRHLLLVLSSSRPFLRGNSFQIAEHLYFSSTVISPPISTLLSVPNGAQNLRLRVRQSDARQEKERWINLAYMKESKGFSTFFGELGIHPHHKCHRPNLVFLVMSLGCYKCLRNGESLRRQVSSSKICKQPHLFDIGYFLSTRNLIFLNIG